MATYSWVPAHGLTSLHLLEMSWHPDSGADQLLVHLQWSSPRTSYSHADPNPTGPLTAPYQLSWWCCSQPSPTKGHFRTAICSSSRSAALYLDQSLQSCTIANLLYPYVLLHSHCSKPWDVTTIDSTYLKSWYHQPGPTPPWPPPSHPSPHALEQTSREVPRMSSRSAKAKSATCNKNLAGSGSPKNTMSGFTMPVQTGQQGSLSAITSA